MENGKDQNDSEKAHLVPAEKTEPEDVAAAAAAAQRTQAPDPVRARPSGDHDAAPVSVAGRLEEHETKYVETLGLGSPPPALLPADLEPGFVSVSGDVGGPGHNETVVDIIAVPCPGADPVLTWTYSPGMCSDWSIASEAGSRVSFRLPSPWITKDLRSAISIARVFLYRHRALHEGMTLSSLTDDLLAQVERERRGLQRRPLFFIAHSIGGLVVKNALVRAVKSGKYSAITENCHGVTFFSTPHRGSSYMSMANLKESIQDLLQLHATLPQSLTDEIRVNNRQLIELHDHFVDMASELRLWSFYETQESSLSGTGAGLTSEVQFGAPLVSVKSALLDLWHEDVYAVEDDHANIASFGPNNRGILASYLADLGAAVNKAARLSIAHKHTPMELESHVEVEIIGFYEDPDAAVAEDRPYAPQQAGEGGSVIRLYSTRYSLKDFFKKGPERCLSERLHEPPKRRDRRRPSRAVSARDRSPAGVDATERSPEIVVTGPLERPPLLKVPVQSEPTVRPSSPESNASVSTTMSEPMLPLMGDITGEGSHSIDMLAKQQAEMMVKEHELTATAGFSRPNPSLRKFMWINLPFNNPVWVKEIFATLAKTQGRDFSRLFDYDNWISKHIQNRHSESQPAFLKPMCKYLSAADRVTSPRIPSGTVPRGITPNCLFLYLPYLHFDTYRSIVRRRKLIEARHFHGRAKPVPEQIAQLDSLELRAIWEYIGYDPPLNYRRTLDQFGHHSLRDTTSRDDDQMLYKLTKKDSPLPWNKPSNSSSVQSLAGSYPLSGKGGDAHGGLDDPTGYYDVDPDPDLKDGYVLMVDQLWLWSIDMTTLTTFFPKRESSPTEGTLFQQADLRNSVYNELNGDLTGRTENALDLAALIVWHAVTVLLDRSSHPDLEIFRLFDEAIGMLAERMTLNMKQFRMHALDMESDDEGYESDESDLEGESPAAIKRRHKRELERAERENRENTSALLELRDLEDELTTLQKLFDIQESTIQQMKEIYMSRELRDSTKNGQDYLDEALEYLEDFKHQTTEMLKRVDTTRNDYEKMLEMVQRQAQVDEVRWSRLQAELASSQNLSVMIFTTFTVIFLPLTFFTGLFGMNTIEWQEENIPSLKEIGAISLPASVLLIILSLVAAFSWRVQSAFKTTYRGAKSAWKMIKDIYSDKLEPESRKEAKRRRREEKKRRRREEQRMKYDKTYDFWAMVKKQQRNLRYPIPEQNVNGAVPPGIVRRRTVAVT